MKNEMYTSRKGFLKRTGLAIASVFGLSSVAAASVGRPEKHGSESYGQRESAPGAHAVPSSAFARVRTAKYAVARQGERF